MKELKIKNAVRENATFPLSHGVSLFDTQIDCVVTP